MWKKWNIKEVPKCESEVVCMQNLVGYGCSELEERIKKDESKCIALELDIQRKKRDYESLKTKFKALEVDLRYWRGRMLNLKSVLANVEGERKVCSGRGAYG